MLEESFSLRWARLEDVDQLTELMHAAIQHLQTPWLSPQQIEGSFEIMGLDTQLILDQTYYLVEQNGQFAGCGGWSRRATLFGGDHSSGRSPRVLDPATEAARVRAMYTHPDFVRRGIGRAILEACEAAARAEAFLQVELAATAAGVPLYEAAGYAPIEAIPSVASNGAEIPLVLMRKTL